MSQRNPPSPAARQKATDIIRSVYATSPGYFREARRRMVEIYWLLTGEMPQVAGIEYDFGYNFSPALEWEPHEADPRNIVSVIPGEGHDPDILIKGDQDGTEEEKASRELGAGPSPITHCLPPKR